MEITFNMSFIRINNTCLFIYVRFDSVIKDVKRC